MYEQNLQEWAELVRALKLGAPTPEYKVLQLAAQRIRALETALQTEHDDCVRVAGEVLGDRPLHYAHQAVWALVREVQRLRAAWSEDHPVLTGEGSCEKDE